MKKNSTLKELLVGLIAVGVLMQIVCLIFLKQHMYHAIGLWTGLGISIGMLIHMQRSIEDGLDLQGDAGVKHMKKAYLTRTAFITIVMAAVMYFNWGNPITILLGIIALKVAVYLQPFVHKVLEKRKKGGNECGENFGNNSK
jgi:hypothetical protein